MEAQFGSTFSNVNSSTNVSVTIAPNEGEIKFNLSLLQKCKRDIFPIILKCSNRRFKKCGCGGRSALYCTQCNGRALTQREGAIFSMLVDEDKRPF